MEEVRARKAIRLLRDCQLSRLPRKRQARSSFSSCPASPSDITPRPVPTNGHEEGQNHVSWDECECEICLMGSMFNSVAGSTS